MIKKIGWVWMIVWMIGCAVLLLSDEGIAQNMKEGLWEITITMEIPGMPRKMPPQTKTNCLSKKDMVPQKAEPGQDCKMVKNEVKGDTVIWVKEYKTKERLATFNGKVTYREESFEGVVKMKQGGTEMTQNLKGKWVGKFP